MINNATEINNKIVHTSQRRGKKNKQEFLKLYILLSSYQFRRKEKIIRRNFWNIKKNCDINFISWISGILNTCNRSCGIYHRAPIYFVAIFSISIMALNYDKKNCLSGVETYRYLIEFNWIITLHKWLRKPLIEHPR